jgi:hypothetical protein
MGPMPQILTANLLRAGEVIYWSRAHGWVPALGEADIMEEADAGAALKNAAQWVEKQEIVAPYLFAVRMTDGAAVPVKQRELIRAAGPTVRRDLGKQAT